MENFLQNIPVLRDPRVAFSLGIVVLAYIIRLMIGRVLAHRVRDVRNRFIWKQTINYAIALLAFGIIIRIWVEWFQSVLTVLSLIAAAITIISKELILNFFAHGVILWRGLFEVGHRIKMGNQMGEVLDIGPLYFTIGEISLESESFTGSTSKIPNMLVLTMSVTNFTRGHPLVWHEISVEITSDSNWKKMREICESVVSNYQMHLDPSKKKEIRSSPKELLLSDSSPLVYMRIKPTGIQFILRFIGKHFQKMKLEDEIWTAILQKLGNEKDVFLLGRSIMETSPTIESQTENSPKG